MAPKRLYYQACFKKYKNDMRKIWKTINEVISKTKKKRDFPEYFKNENDQINDKLQIANKFNIFFTDVGKDLARQIKNPGNKKYSDYLDQSYTCKLTFQSVNEEQVKIDR